MTSVIVVGAGAIGLASAFHLRKSGADVTVIDPAPLAQKASGHNAGWLIPSMSTPVPAPGMLPQAMKWMLQRDSPLYIKPDLNPQFAKFLLQMLFSSADKRYRKGSDVLANLSNTALSSFDELAADGVAFEAHSQPLTMLFMDEHKRDGRVAELELLDGKLPGFSWSHLSTSEMRAELPSLSDAVVAAIQSEGDRSVDPATLVKGLADACRAEGVDLRLGEKASLVRSGPGSSGDRVRVKVGGGTGNGAGVDFLDADKIVVAAGAWTNEILGGIGEKIALQSGKGYGYDLPVTTQGPNNPLYLAEAKVAVTPLDTKIRLAGTMGFSGVDENTDAVRAGGILTGVSKYFNDWPDVETAPAPWTGLRPMTPDGIPTIGPLPGAANVIVATGHAMLGISLAPVTGKLVTDLVNGTITQNDIPALAPDRF